MLTSELCQLPSHKTLHSCRRAAHARQHGQGLHVHLGRPRVGSPASRALDAGLEHLGEGQG